MRNGIVLPEICIAIEIDDRARSIWDSIIRGESLMLCGPTACGKRTLAEAVCSKLNVNPYTISSSYQSNIDYTLAAAEAAAVQNASNWRNEYGEALASDRDAVWIPPTVLLVDDLDRTSVQVQKDLLSALYKFDRLCLVAMFNTSHSDYVVSKGEVLPMYEPLTNYLRVVLF